jgi:UDP-N-acetylglucosamine 2-epimerase (non-hydrolysing)
VPKLERLLSAIDAVAEELPVIFPVHPRTQERLREARVKYHQRLRLIPPVGYLDFLFLLERSRLVMTDSGGIQEETTALGIPCLTLRDNTERPVTVTAGTNQLVGQDPARIITSAREILGGKTKRGQVPQLWDGHSAERIIEILLRGAQADGIERTVTGPGGQAVSSRGG